MQRHCEIGAEIIASIARYGAGDPVLQIAQRIALSHHENWDGSGYPLGQAKEQIPLEARIMTVADVYDALRSKRPYKEAFTHRKALAIMASEKYKFDPTIYQIFLDNEKTFDRIFLGLNN
jgi:HD-GYP domain-containing protein (c-di-GMP phosphodiesterase class II)